MTLEQIQAEVGKGWSKLLADLYTDLIALGWDGHVAQVKEKFGGLRFYIDNGNEFVYNRIYEAEEQSYNVCESCGELGHPRVKSYWTKTLCDRCFEKA